MADIVLQHNVGSLGTTRNLNPAAGPSSQVAGATAAVTSATLDRRAFASGSLPQSAEIAILYTATLAANKTLSFTQVVNSSPDGTTWTLLETALITLVATGAGTFTGQLSNNVDLTSAGRFLQVVTTPTMSNTSTDTAAFSVVGFFAGFDRLSAGT